MTVAFDREGLACAVRTLTPFDLHVLLRTALAAHPKTREFAGPWGSLAGVLGLEPVLVHPALERLVKGGFVDGPMLRSETVRLRLGKLLEPAEPVPLNLPLEPL